MVLAVSHGRMGYRFRNDWTPAEILEITKDYASVVTILVNVSIDTEHRVYDFDIVEKLQGKRGR